jgi:dihydroxy-acid dehydratase
VVLTTGCDKTTPALLMAAATVNIPAIALSVGPMLNGWFKGERTGSGTIVWKGRELMAKGELDEEGFIKLVASSAPSTGYCNTMGTATTMNSLAEALGMMLPCRDPRALPRPAGMRLAHRQARGRDGPRGPEANGHHDARCLPQRHRRQFRDRRVDQRPIHLAAIARHVGVDLPLTDWQRLGHRCRCW